MSRLIGLLLVTKLQKPLGASLVLGLAMSISAVWILAAGRGLTFSGDELYYYARLVAHGGAVVPAHGLEYFFAPHNGHLVVVGRLIFRLLFAIAGTNYFVFRVVEVAGVLLCVALFFVLARRRVSPLAALAPSVLLLFLGYAQETLLWPFDLHTVYALAFGLAALLALEHDDRRGDIAACALLVLSVATIEVGLAFVVGVAVSVLLGPERSRRAWIFLVPVVLYAAWWVWARQFHQPAISLLNVHLIPIDLTNALAAVAGSIFGLNPTGVGIAPEVTTVTAWGTVVAGFSVVALMLRIRQANVPRSLWVSLAVVITYWVTVALGDRPPDSSRYIFVGTIMVLLIAADAIRGIKLSPLAVAGLFCVVALAIPANIAKLYDGRRPRLTDASASQTEYAMLELARHRVDPSYTPGTDPTVAAAGGSVFTSLSAGDYLRASREFGSLAFSLNQVRGEELAFQRVADVTLVDGLRIHLRSAPSPLDPGRCPSPSVTEATPHLGDIFQIPRKGVLLGSRSNRTVGVSVSRFARSGPSVSLGKLRPGHWASLKTPIDSAPDPWRVLVDGPVYVCQLR